MSCSRLSKAALRRVKRRDRVARWVVTLGGVAVIVSVVAHPGADRGNHAAAVSVRARGQRAGRAAAAGVAGGRGRGGRGRRDGRGRREVAGRPRARPGRDVSRSSICRPRQGVLKRLPACAAGLPGGARPFARSSSVGPGGLCSVLVRTARLAGRGAASRRRQRRGRDGRPACTVRTRATIPAGKGPAAAGAILRAHEDKEGCRRLRALLPGNRILRLPARSARKTCRAKRPPRPNGRAQAAIVPAHHGRWRWTAAATTLYAGTTDGALLWWRLADDGQSPSRTVVPAFRDKRAITSLGLLFGDVSLAVGDDRGQTDQLVLRAHRRGQLAETAA